MVVLGWGAFSYERGTPLNPNLDLPTLLTPRLPDPPSQRAPGVVRALTGVWGLQGLKRSRLKQVGAELAHYLGPQNTQDAKGVRPLPTET